MSNHMSNEADKPIRSLVIDYNQRVADWNPCIGDNGITKIERCYENGEMALITWYAIYVGDAVRCRINSKYVVEVGF